MPSLIFFLGKRTIFRLDLLHFLVLQYPHSPNKNTLKISLPHMYHFFFKKIISLLENWQRTVYQGYVGFQQRLGPGGTPYTPFILFLKGRKNRKNDILMEYSAFKSRGGEENHDAPKFNRLSSFFLFIFFDRCVSMKRVIPFQFAGKISRWPLEWKYVLTCVSRKDIFVSNWYSPCF